MEQEKIAKIIKEIRKQNNLTQKEFADKLNVTYQAVSKWENGKNIPDITILKKISEDYEIDFEELLNGNYSLKEKKNNKLIIIISIIIFLSIILFIWLMINLSSNNDFQFKTISTECRNFTISGSLAYNENKSSIYISNIQYCGGDDNRTYSDIECFLYEETENVKTLITTCNKGKNVTLENFLENLQLNVDNYKQNCKNYINNSLYLEITATNAEYKTTTYKIPLVLNDNCKF